MKPIGRLTVPAASWSAARSTAFKHAKEVIPARPGHPACVGVPHPKRDGVPPSPSFATIVAVFVAVLLTSAASLTSALAQSEAPPAKQADFLFVQTAQGMTFDKATSTLTLQGVSPITVFFSDRPERIAGNMQTAAFVPFWSKGKESFLSDAPNADVSILDGDTLRQVVVVLEAPVLHGDALSYTVKVLQGDMPATGVAVSVFIDVIGMPLTPLSYAGVARRSYRRAVLYR
jgi:hypothetical protein